MKWTITALAAALLCTSIAISAQSVEVVRVLDVPRERYQELVALADFWSVDRRREAVVMAVTPQQRRAIEALGFEVRIDPARMRSLEYARSVDHEAWQRGGLSGIPGYSCYRTVDETKADLSALAAARPDLARWESIGQTWLEANGQAGGDDIYVLVLGNRNSPHEQAPFMIMAAQHARELATAETATRFAEWLIENYDTDSTARWLLDHREIHVIAQQNPDGRREAEAGPILWRKNANLDHCPGGSWTGVDLNRNSDYFWGTHSDTNACSQTFRGAAESSEPETAAVQAYMDQVFTRARPGSPGNLPTDPAPDDTKGLFISIHSYSQLVLFPWEGSGDGTANNAPNHDQLAWLGRKFGFFTGYDVGRDILYSAGGTMTDYAYGEFGVAAYTYEIGTDFFQDCASFEQSMIGKLTDSLTYAAKAARRPYQAPSGPDIVDATATWNAQTGELTIAGRADDARFDRGGVTEAPATDPVSTPAQIRASFEVPPDQAAAPMSVNLAGAESSLAFEAQLTPVAPVTTPQLLFLQATDSDSNVGVPEAVWVVEQRAALSPQQFTLQLIEGETAQRALSIENIGSSPLDWTLVADETATGRASPDPALDEALAISDFTLQGNSGTYQATSAGGKATRGRVVGFSFMGDVTGLDGNQTWASDMAMTVTAPGGSAHSVGGFNSGNPPWDFDGESSSGNGAYSSEHIADEIFGAEGVDDQGSWQFDFLHTFDDPMSWSNVTVTLHKQAPPQCFDPTGVGWLTAGAASGQLQPGEEMDIVLDIDSTGLDPGSHQAVLCFGSNDPAGDLRVVEVTLEVTDETGEVFRDRFEPLLP